MSYTHITQESLIQPPPILMTKLALPPTRTPLTPRDRLLERLAAGAHRKLTLVSAPAGFGKTTLVASWLNPQLPAGALLVAWLSLDDSDDDPVRFWTYVVNALQTVQPELGRRTLELLAEPRPANLETALTLLINDLAVSAAPLFLVLDDYHVIDDEAVHASLTFLLDHLPPRLHLVIISRSDPPLPVARLRARNQLSELRTDDLRFTSTEAAAFLNQAMGLTL
ncbi:MAG TPA: AAA family ATPase, partial [Anaerolineae bacterium]|nr:AAA family ATPase [Anaerolineae bacterium]